MLVSFLPSRSEGQNYPEANGRNMSKMSNGNGATESSINNFNEKILTSPNLADSFKCLGVETEVRSSLVSVSLHKWFHVRDTNEPETLFFVIKPASIVTITKDKKINKKGWHQLLGKSLSINYFEDFGENNCTVS